MRIVVDMQAAQSERLRQRGEFIRGLVRELASSYARGNEVIAVVNGAMRDTVAPIRRELDPLLGREHVRVWYPPCVEEGEQDCIRKGFRRVAERLRQGVIAELSAEVLVDPLLGWDPDLELVGRLGDLGEPCTLVGLLPGQDSLEARRSIGSDEASTNTAVRPDELNLAHCLLEVPGLTVQGEDLPAVKEPERIARISDSAQAASEVAEQMITRTAARGSSSGPEETPAGKQPTLAFVTPWPPAKTGIAYYSAELLPELAKYYTIDVVSDQETAEEVQSAGARALVGIEEFLRTGRGYDRVVYQVGNSGFHGHMWDLMKMVPGVAVVHDFYLGDAVAYREERMGITGELIQELYWSHGYAATAPIIIDEDRKNAVSEFPASHTPFREARAVIVHSEHARWLAQNFYGMDAAHKTSIVPHPREVVPIDQEYRFTARRDLGLAMDDFVVVTFGIVNGNKLPGALFDAWCASELYRSGRAKLIFAGELADEAARETRRRAVDAGVEGRVKFTGWLETNTFRKYQAAADVAVQLRQNSRGETSGTVLDCMAAGLPTVCNAHGSFSEIDDAAVWKIGDPCSATELAGALGRLHADRDLRQDLGRRAQEAISVNHSPARCGSKYWCVLEKCYSEDLRPQRLDVVRTAAEALPIRRLGPGLAEAIGRSLPQRCPQRQLLVDVSVVANKDLRTGVQRVVRSILSQLLHAKIKRVRIEPVYTHENAAGFFYAREFTERFLGGTANLLSDGPVEVRAGDVFLGLDLHANGIVSQEESLRDIRDQGAKVVFVVHDLLPVTNPEWFPVSERPMFEEWLRVICQFDGAICVSNATANALRSWRAQEIGTAEDGFELMVAHNGADIDESVPSKGMPEDGEAVVTQLERVPTFLMVGTVEPRKGVAQALSAFERLWSKGSDVNLVIVGKEGWGVDELSARIRKHRERGKRLFWLSEATDEYLERVYQASSCLLAASEAEGFGLPLIEAAQYGCPILARDIPVFREVAGSYAEYFEAPEPEALAETLVAWLGKYRAGRHPRPDGMPYKSWGEATDRYREILGLTGTSTASSTGGHV